MTSPKVDSGEERLQAKLVKVKYRGLKDDFLYDLYRLGQKTIFPQFFHLFQF